MGFLPKLLIKKVKISCNGYSCKKQQPLSLFVTIVESPLPLLCARGANISLFSLSVLSIPFSLFSHSFLSDYYFMFQIFYFLCFLSFFLLGLRPFWIFPPPFLSHPAPKFISNYFVHCILFRNY